MSTRNGPQARANPIDDGRPSGTVRKPTPSMRDTRAESVKALAMQEEVARADGDYQRLRGAYLEIAQTDPDQEVALAMIGADMNRAHARLQALVGLPRLPFAHEPGSVVRRDAQRVSDD